MLCSKCKQDKTEDQFSWKKKNVVRSTVCKSCHRDYTKKHYRENSAEYRLRTLRDKQKEDEKTKLLVESLKESGCVVCGELRLPVLQFHHLDPSKKEDSIARLSSRKKILDEVKKCVVLCANCHMMEHFLNREGKSQLRPFVQW